jgi:Tol biopolymer transport system component
MGTDKKYLVVLFFVFFLAASAQAKSLPDINATTRIVYAHGPKQYTNLYTMKPDGSDQRQLTDIKAKNWEPAWSPDGTSITFTSNRDGEYEIFIMNADGSDQRQLTHNNTMDRLSTWAPDSSTIYFICTQGTAKAQLFSMLPNGTQRTQLTNQKLHVSHPSCSPDGKKIVFQLGGIAKGSKIQSEIYSINIDGTGLTNLSNNPAHDKVAVFSPDGKYITFQSYRDGNFELYRMRADGSEQTRLTTHPAKDKRSTWAPDGNLICYQDFRKGHWELFTMKPDGSDIRQITKSETDSKHPHWSGFLGQKKTPQKK